MKRSHLWWRALAGGLCGGLLAYLVTTLLDSLGIETDLRTVQRITGSLVFGGAFVGAFGFWQACQMWNDGLDRIDDSFSTP